MRKAEKMKMDVLSKFNSKQPRSLGCRGEGSPRGCSGREPEVGAQLGGPCRVPSSAGAAAPPTGVPWACVDQSSVQSTAQPSWQRFGLLVSGRDVSHWECKVLPAQPVAMTLDRFLPLSSARSSSPRDFGLGEPVTA